MTGQPIGELVADAECYNREVIRAIDEPLQPAGTGTAILHGNLCPRGAVIKQSAATPELLVHTGRAVVFDSPEAYHAVSDDDDLDITADDVIVIRNAGPRGYPGMPEVANVALPRKLLQQGIDDMVRICDGRMSGTGFGTVVLHVAPEAAIGGPLGLVRTGDLITLDVPRRSLEVQLTDDELAARRTGWVPPVSAAEGGWPALYVEHVLQADQGADLDFLRGGRGAGVPRDSH